MNIPLIPEANKVNHKLIVIYLFKIMELTKSMSNEI